MKKSAIAFWALLHLTGALLPVFLYPLIGRVVDAVSAGLSAGELGSGIYGLLLLLCVLLLLRSVYGVLPDVARFALMAQATIPVQNEFMHFTEEIPLHYFNDAAFANEVSEVGGNTSWVIHTVNESMGILAKLVSLAGMLAVASSVSWYLLPICLASTAVHLWNGRKVRRMYDEQYEAMQQNRRTAAYLEDLFSDLAAAKEIRLLGASEKLLNKWRSASQKHQEDSLALEEADMKSSALPTVIIKIANAAVLLLAAWLVFRGKSTVGAFFMLFAMVPDMLGSSFNISRVIGMLLQRLHRVVREKDLFAQTFENASLPDYSEKDVTPENPNTVFALEDVSFAYQEGKAVLKNLRLSIQKGEIVALCGFNGAGKSTLIKLLLGLYAPTKGRILFEGLPYGQLTRKYLGEKIGVVFQDYAEFQMPIRYNIAFGDIRKVEDDEALWAAAQKSQASHLIKRFPKQLDTSLGKRFEPDGVELSGGETQRIMVARAHLSDREVLILDEPAAKIDPLAEIEQFRQIKQTLAGRTGILVSHRMGFARLAGRILVFEEGELKEDGTHESLMAQNGLYAEMFNAQAEWYARGVKA